MTRVNVDHTTALSVLREAVSNASGKRYSFSSKHSRSIEAIITGSHLTYRYVLFTALLAKATDSRIHPLALQAGANLDGAYDARSLCHSVVVPYEKQLLENGLGGSNEPYLNKPARFTSIDLSNAVRQGSDKRTLQSLHSVLSAITTSEEAMVAFSDAIAYILRKKAKDTSDLSKSVARLTGGRHEIEEFVGKLISRSGYGESCVLGAAGLLWLMAITRGEKWTIEVHPVNESGASSNEVGDIDVKAGGRLIYTAEVKDKIFIGKDVDHAVARVAKAGFHTLHFIEGPRAGLVGASYEDVKAQAFKSGVELYHLSLASMATSIIAFAPRDILLKHFASVVSQFAREARVRDETLDHLKSLYADMK